MVKALPRLPLVEDLTTGPVPAGSNILVEYDPTSQWYNASLTIAAGWLKSEENRSVRYEAAAQPPDHVRSQLKRLGLDASLLENRLVDAEYERLQIFDTYTVSLGQKSTEKYHWDSLKVADMSVAASRDFMRRAPSPDRLIIIDDDSMLARFNDERAWVELELTRFLPIAGIRKMVYIVGVMKGVLSDWVYKKLEGACEIVVDFRLDETSDPPRDLMRIRSARNVGVDRRWHGLKVGENFEVTLEK